jgi:hypothetical protein
LGNIKLGFNAVGDNGQEPKGNHITSVFSRSLLEVHVEEQKLQEGKPIRKGWRLVSQKNLTMVKTIQWGGLATAQGGTRRDPEGENTRRAVEECSG